MIMQKRVLELEFHLFDKSSIHFLIMISIATSIDTLAIGISFACLDIAVFTPAFIIGITTFLFSGFGVYIGKKFGYLFESKIEIFGGVILILMGLKILLDHTVFI
jgi:putative Mn2+ efflux pump MntP